MNYVQRLVVAGLMVAIGGCASSSTPEAPPTVNVTGK